MIGLGKPAAAANSGYECSGLRSPHIRYSNACCGDTGMANSKSGARVGGSEDVDGPRSPPKPPSPRAKIDRFCFHSTVPSGADTVVSDQITAALPLSQMSVNRVTAIPVPDGGMGPGADTVHRVAARTEAQVVKLNIATGPSEFGGRKLGAQRLVEVDGHQFFPAMCSAAR